MKTFTKIAQLVIGLTFIFSGYVKLVDPIGTAIKMEEYFSEDVLNLPFLIPYALPISVFLIMTELLLGVAVLTGYKIKWSAYLSGLLLAVFLFLTWYSAYYDKVTDCGCFGDAVKLSPWGTFYKNIFLGILSVILIKGRHYIRPLKNKIFSGAVVFLSFMAGLFITYYVLLHLPLQDFRPYAIGKSIPEGMKEVEGVDIPPVHDFVLETPDGNDLTGTVLQADKVLLFISYNLNLADREGFEKLKEFSEKALKKGYTVYFLTASYVDDFMQLKNTYAWNFDMLYADETTLKTMIRANPGVMVLHKGTVTDKRNWRDIRNIAL